MDIYDGYFELIIKENEGVFLKIYPKKENGKNVEIDQIDSYLKSKGFSEYDEELLLNTLKNLKKEVEIKISDDEIKAIDEGIEINISLDKLEAYVRFYPPVGNGKYLTKDDIINALDNKNVIYGIDITMIDEIIKSKDYYIDYLIAKGKNVVEGKDGELTYYFEKNIDKKPTVNNDGTVDFHKLNIITNVKKDDLLAELVPEIEGTSGIDVNGNEIKPNKVRKLTLKYGKNVRLSEDKLRLYAEKDGHVKLEDGKVVVDDYYEIQADVDSSTGDIEFDGSVIVKGNVRTGFSIKAKGDIEVEGVVEGAKLICDGQVLLKRGIQGMGKGLIEAKGNLITKFIENSTVKVGGFIQSEAILHSIVAAKEEITVDGKKGMLTGGDVRSGKEIKVKILGSHMGTVTSVEVGIDPTISDKYNQISQEIKEIREESKKMEQIITLLKNKKNQNRSLDAGKVQMLQKATRNKIFLNNKLKTNLKIFEEYTEVIDNKNTGKIKVMNIAYPGVKVTIGSIKYYVREEIKYSTLYKDGADIKVTNYS
ncbi:MAG: DUF342 domain-containing protein [Eubacteriales bacterium]